MDGDVFGRAMRIGRDAAEAVLHALDGGSWDPFCAERCLDVLFADAGGVPSLPGVLNSLRDLNESPLFASLLTEKALQRIEVIVVDAKGTRLDLLLRDVVQKCVLSGVYDPREVLRRFFEKLLEQAIITGRGGLLEKHGFERLPEARALLSPVASDAADVLHRQTGAKSLNLARRHACIEPETNLLEGYA